MKERLIQLLDLEQLTPSKFADIIGVQRSSISHVLSGRNKPSFDFLQKTLKAFPGLNASWLMLGEGTMYEQMGRPVSGNLFDTPETPETPEIPVEVPESSEEQDLQGITENGTVTGSDKSPEAVQEPVSSQHLKEERQEPTGGQAAGDASRRIIQVLVFYDDDTFRAYRPAL